MAVEKVVQRALFSAHDVLSSGVWLRDRDATAVVKPSTYIREHVQLSRSVADYVYVSYGTAMVTGRQNRCAQPCCSRGGGGSYRWYAMLTNVVLCWFYVCLLVRSN